MVQICDHNFKLKDLINGKETQDLSVFRKAVNLDDIDIVLRECLSREEMREAGSFFTGQKLATEAIQLFQKAITFESIILDPTCGAGNLLIEASRKLGVEKTLTATLQAWGAVLWGFDIHETFIEATKLRLILEALSRGVELNCSTESAFNFLKNIKVKDALSVTKEELEKVTHVIMNPPFTLWESPKNEFWKNGKINAAGIISYFFFKTLPKECQIVAILPEVLRCGSRYEDFRTNTSVELSGSCLPWGRFNSKTDVDVFLLVGCCNQESDSEIRWYEESNYSLSLGDLYDVRVGPLVAYRDPEEGKELPYFHSRNLSTGKILTRSNETRKFLGKSIKTPCVLIKRTSSPSDKQRAAATLVNLVTDIFVENHLIIVSPKNGTLEECKKVMDVLNSNKTNDFLNEQMRLRHLTVKIIKNIPI